MIEPAPGAENAALDPGDPSAYGAGWGQKLAQGGRLWLFLDYDGTLAEFAPTPDTILPDPELINLLAGLAKYPDRLRVVIMSGRRFSHIQKLLPVPGILEAGTYGIEFVTWQGEQVRLLDFETARPFLDQLKQRWQAIIQDREKFYLEDKGFSLAIHARFALGGETRSVMAEASRAARQIIHEDTFHLLEGERFIEVAPLIADKGQSVSMLLHRFPWPGADILYFGDDDKDEEAFKIVLQNHGTPVLVAAERRPTHALRRLENPREVRKFLKSLLGILDQQSPV